MSAPTGVVDAHTHVLLPPRVAARVRELLEAHGDEDLLARLDPAGLPAATREAIRGGTARRRVPA